MTADEETALRDETPEPEFKTFKPKEEGLSGWEYKPNGEKAKEVEAEFKEDFVVDVEVKEEEKKKMEKEVKGEKEVKEETQAEKKERYIDILVGIGFLKGKDKGDGKERYYYKINDNSAVGRTFDSRTPLGKFWAKINGEWLKDKECKEVEIIKRFYTIRGGEEEMPERPKEIARREPVTVERKIMEGHFKVRGGFYPISGKKEPDAWTVQQWANSSGVSIEVRETTQTKEFAKATVRAHLNKQFADETVIHFFDVSKEILAYEIIAKMYAERKQPIDGYDEEGKPILTSEAMERIYKRFIRFKNFSIRDAISKASRRATLKIINKDWREEAEIESEEQEVKAVQEGN